VSWPHIYNEEKSRFYLRPTFTREMEWPTFTVPLAVLVPLVVVAVDIVRRTTKARIERKGYPLPPGPTPLPVLGNVLSVGKEPWLTYTDWKEKYGEYHVEMVMHNLTLPRRYHVPSTL
jgi:hypothetical protein